MPLASATTRPRFRSASTPADRAPSVLVACPDARPPAYEAVAGLARANRLNRFVTGFHYNPAHPICRLGHTLLGSSFSRIERSLRKRSHPEIDAARVRSTFSFDTALRVEQKLGGSRGSARLRVAKWRTDHFDRLVAREIDRQRPGSVLLFSDVGSEQAGPQSRRLGIPTVLSMVHGDVREEMTVLEAEKERSPDVFHLYLGDTPLDLDEMAWLHARRLRDLSWADRILVPSDHIAGELKRHGTDPDRIRVIPYAADTDRFRPLPDKRHTTDCSFLFAGGICQRKGIKYLLQAWSRIRRPGWRLQLLGAAPRQIEPLSQWLEEVEFLGRVPHAEVPARMAAADVFVFPSLFEGSAVVTYEAIASGLPSVVTPSAGSVVRDGVDGILVPPADVESLAMGMERLGQDPELRAQLGASARRRALDFDWPRYQAALIRIQDELATPSDSRE